MAYLVAIMLVIAIHHYYSASHTLEEKITQAI